MFMPYDNFNTCGYGGLPLQSIAWLMFMETGETGYFMLYNDLKNEKQDRTLE